MEEDYVSFETAKLLKEKGFNWNTDKQYNLDKIVGDYDITDRSRYPERYLDAPTIQMVMKWLREVHHYYIQVMLDSWACGGHTGYYVVIQRTDNDFEMMLQDAVDEVFYQTYEEACEAAIKYCLESLI